MRVLSLDSLDLIYRELKQQGCLAAARLACSWLRALVDGSVRELVVRERAPVRAPPSLARWPRCTAIVLAPRPPPPELARAAGGELHETDVLLHAPFLGQPESARRRITSLRLQADEQSALRGVRVGPAAAALASYLPCLRSLDLSSLLPADGSHPARVVTAADTALLHVALALLPALESVSLPSALLLPGIEALAGRLRSLSAGSPHRLRSGLPHYFEELRPGAAEGISKLSRLEALTLSAVDGRPSTGPVNGLQELLNSLPPSLRRLELKDCCLWIHDSLLSLAASWEGGGGRLASLDLDFTQLRNPWLSDTSQAPALLEQLVLSWLTLQRGVRSLSVRKVALERALAAPLLRLLALADEAEVGTLRLPECVTEYQLRPGGELWAIWACVREVRLDIPCGHGLLLSLPRQAQPPAPAQPPFQLPTPEEVWALAVQHALAATDLPDWLASQQGSGSLMLLTGPPAEAGLAAAGRGELGEWLAELCREFRTALSEREAGEAQAAPLSAASCVLVTARPSKPSGAAARAVTQALQEAGSRRGGAVRRLSSTLFPWGLQQVLQRLWAEAVAAGSVLVTGGLWAGSSVAAGPDLVGALLRWAVSVRGHAWFLIRPLETWPGGTRC
ncbi:hypothetical protein HYH03_003296 [Edaphochlamys debaryana]|uniref:Uncharacterized protein n=1 Tax=Edaphochlamys debaryana TaxID=47281 RepID=A0A835YH20_9CHLO|nr:hypothetical protein HYH03_003296 [Edaphochlamys debaryana]|eukprot:KAG2498545.1 hypothetical protein HYH03_003296 [Edaphochlamys debaryana]